MNSWEEERKLIDNLRIMYPQSIYWYNDIDLWNDDLRAEWVAEFCVDILNQRIPQIELFLQSCPFTLVWSYYKYHFKI